jgi:predicted dehydrogenase
MFMTNIGVIGYGYWGPNLVRNFMEAKGSSVTMVSDMNQKQLDRAKSRYPNIATTTDFNELVTNPNVDAVVIATPVFAHHKLAMAALQNGKHVFVEKPMASSVAECQEMIAEAEKRKLVLHVDHTFVYTGAVRKIAELAQSGDLGDLYYYDSTRVNLGLFQHDVNVIWDLAVHDLAIIEYIINREPRAVSATGMSHVPGEPENIAFLTIYYDNNFIAHVNVNWLAPVKIRRTLIGGSKKMVSYDMLDPAEGLKIYDKGITATQAEDVYKLMINYRSGDMYSPQIDVSEALLTEANHFIQCINTGQKTITDGYAGLRVVKILEAATKSIANRGTVVDLG